MRIGNFLFVIIFLIAACHENDGKNNSESNLFSADSLGKDISILASDEFQGRKPFTEGETKTINYLKKSNQMQICGVCTYRRQHSLIKILVSLTAK
jgi:hypothetical protein